ncbi:unnamed protein product [Merluccius merluccius]
MLSPAGPSQQWCPTSAQVAVLQARGLRVKGRNGTNDAYVAMQVGKDKFTSSVAEKSVAPMWKDQARFDLPPVQSGGPVPLGGPVRPGTAERCTLHVHVMHRALVGPDKLLGRADVDLLELRDERTKNQPQWFKLLDKAGKADKERGDILLDIQFMRNNMTASMFDLSAPDKSRSRLGKFKDKLRGKKKDGGLDSASAIVPSSFSQVLTDSEEEEEEEEEEGVEGSAGDTREKNSKKKLKLKSLFSHKSNLQKSMSQSMSGLGPLPERNQTLSGSRSSGLNVEFSEVKKKFKFGIHKRSGSTDSKASQGSSRLPDQSQHGGHDASRSSSHAYTEEAQGRASSRASSTFSLSSSGRGSMEDLHRGQGGSMEGSFSSYDSLRAPRQTSVPWMGSKATEEEVEGVEEEEEEVREYEQMRRKEEEEKDRQEELMRIERRREEEEEQGKPLAPPLEEWRRLGAGVPCAPPPPLKTLTPPLKTSTKPLDPLAAGRPTCRPPGQASESQPESKDYVSEKKRRAPLPPSDRERPQDELCNPSVTVSKVHSVSPLGGFKTKLHCDEGSDEDKENNPMSQSRNVESNTKDVASSSARVVSGPSAHDDLNTSCTPKNPENTQETRAELLEMATRSLSSEWPWKTEATAEREVRVQTAAGPASVRVQTAASPVSPSRRPLGVSKQQSPSASVSVGGHTPEEPSAGRDNMEDEATLSTPGSSVKQDEATRPFSQLTREELLSLLQKLQSQLTQKDSKISELEQYIDNLLVRIMEEQPSILMSLSSEA